MGGHRLEVAQHRDAPRVVVETTGVRALDGAGHAAGAALEHLPVLVHQCVVGDVAPAQGARVVLVDRPDDPGRVLRRVFVAARGVVHDAGLDPVVVAGFTASHRLVGAPFGAVDDVGRLAGRSRGVRQRRQVGRRLGRADQHGVDVLPERLFHGRGHVAQRGGVPSAPGCRGGRRGGGRVGGSGDRDLHGRRAADEHGVGSAQATPLRTGRRRRPPGSPRRTRVPTIRRPSSRVPGPTFR